MSASSLARRSTKRVAKRTGRKVLRSYFRFVRPLPFPARMMVHMGVLGTVPVLALNVLDTLLPWLLAGAVVMAAFKFLKRF